MSEAGNAVVLAVIQGDRFFTISAQFSHIQKDSLWKIRISDPQKEIVRCNPLTLWRPPVFACLAVFSKLGFLAF